MNRKMKRLSRKLIAALCVSAMPAIAHAQNQLVDGKKITLPPVGTLTQPLANPTIYNNDIPNIGSHAANLVATPDGKFAIASDLGFRQYLSVVNTSTGALVSQAGYGAPYVSGTFGLFYGLAFNPIKNGDGTWTLYAAQGAYHAYVGTGAARQYYTTIAIIRENRTYDQVLGDLNTPAFGNLGNGDPTLNLFGAAVTPNVHNFAQQYVLLDNFYDIGDASMAGWDWSTTALNNEHIARNQPYNYSSRGSSYDSEGTVNNYPVGGFPAGTQGYYVYDANGNATTLNYSAGLTSGGVQLPTIPDAGGHPNGRIFDTMLRAGNTIRNYGALIANGYPAYGTIQPGGHYDAAMGVFSAAVAGNTDLDFSGYDNTYAESPAPYSIDPTLNGGAFLPPHKTFGKYAATNRFSEWKREFDAMLANDPTGATVPNFELVRFGRDHTQGLNYNHASAKAEVADNDYAVGKFVDAISHSPIWNHSAIFILEDDAQNGPDHVDSHRSVGFVVSPYIKAGSHVSHLHNTASFLHTMEMLLNAKPLTQYDAVADPIDAWDTAPNNNAAYNAVLPGASILSEVLTSGQYETKLEKREYRRMVALASKMDLIHADAADPALLNEMIWKSVKGITAKYPVIKHTGPIDSLIAKKAVKAGKATAKAVRDADND